MDITLTPKQYKTLLEVMKVAVDQKSASAKQIQHWVEHPTVDTPAKVQRLQVKLVRQQEALAAVESLASAIGM